MGKFVDVNEGCLLINKERLCLKEGLIRKFVFKRTINKEVSVYLKERQIGKFVFKRRTNKEVSV